MNAAKDLIAHRIKNIESNIAFHNTQIDQSKEQIATSEACISELRVALDHFKNAYDLLNSTAARE